MYLVLLEQARFEWMARLGATANLDHVIARLEIDYRGELGLDSSVVECSFSVTHIGRTSFRTRETVRTPDGAVAAEAEGVFVAWDGDARTARPLHEDERAALSAAQTEKVA